MTLRTKILLVAVLLTLTTVPAVQAGWTQELHRSLGLWWSDGYHSHCDCPPGHQRDCYATPRRKWQPSPAASIEYLPAPAPLPLDGEKSSRRPVSVAPRSLPAPNQPVR